MYAAQHGTQSTIEESGGVLLAYANRDLTPGECLTFNYGPPELVASWDLAKRRAFLRAHM